MQCTTLAAKVAHTCTEQNHRCSSAEGKVPPIDCAVTHCVNVVNGNRKHECRQVTGTFRTIEKTILSEAPAHAHQQRGHASSAIVWPTMTDWYVSAQRLTRLILLHNGAWGHTLKGQSRTSGAMYSLQECGQQARKEGNCSTL
eukprot:1160647-Pelagomonas_calceolata.AAC.4